MNIAFVDLQRQYATIAPEIDAAIAGVIGRSAFVGGPAVEQFEREFAEYCGARHCIGLANGTDALELALRALAIGPGDEVITVPNSFIATAAAIAAVGARPVFVDIDPLTQLLDAARLPDAITPRTRAIMPVHLYGQPADLDAIQEVADAFGLRVIEDACQAHGARYKGRRVGAIGDVGCFSFYPGKNLGAYGDGGALVTNSDEIAARVRQFGDHGRIDKYRHAVLGRNSRLDGMQAAILSAKLRHLDSWNAARRRIAAELTAGLAESGVVTPTVAPDVESVFHLYVIQTTARDAVADALREAGIASGIHYPIPIHLQPAFQGRPAALGVGRDGCPIAEEQAGRLLSLPIYPELQDDEIERICRVVEGAAKPRPAPIAFPASPARAVAQPAD
jgi:dTDP-4-amino-4,6-dideoxygalactose transaminase